MLRQHLRSRSDLGLRKAVSAGILEPHNPFGPRERRKPRRWFVLLLTVLFALTVAFMYFNFAN